MGKAFTPAPRQSQRNTDTVATPPARGRSPFARPAQRDAVSPWSSSYRRQSFDDEARGLEQSPPFHGGSRPRSIMPSFDLVHTKQHPGTIARVPAAPTDANDTPIPFDRSKATITGVPASVVAVPAGNTVTLTPFTVTPSFSAPEVNHLSWLLYDPSDALVSGSSTLAGSPTATDHPWTIGGTMPRGNVTQGRYLLRLIGRKDGVPFVYSDATSFVWTETPTAMKTQSELSTIKSQPDKHGFGDVGAAHARSMMLDHQAAVTTTGVGTVQGNQCSTAPPTGSSPAKHDCTTYVLDVLKATFAAKGQSAEWTTVFKEAQTLSGGAFKGTALLQALISKAGWKSVFWSPDPRNPSDGKPEHPVAYKGVKNSGTYYGVPVEKGSSVIDYKPTSAKKQESMGQLDKLRQVPLAVIAARGGTHMTLLLSGIVYEVHWELPVTNADVIEATPLEQWEWNSGVVAMPAGDYNAIFKP